MQRTSLFIGAHSMALLSDNNTGNNNQSVATICNTNRTTITSITKTTTKATNKNIIKMPGRFNSRLAFFAFTISLIMMVVLISVDGVYSLNCYHCSNADNPECDEAFTGKANFTETNCEKYINQPAKVCRKIVQYIEHKKVVIRSCGFIDENADKEQKPMCHKRSGTFAIMMESCSCYTDNCNHSASLLPRPLILLLLLTLPLLLCA